MAIADRYGLFWNSDSGDRKYDAQSFEKWLKKFFTSGVFEGDLQVLASSGMTVQVQRGYSNVNGKVGLFESATNVTLSAANSRYPRIDTIIIERNDADRVIQIDKVTGAYTGENPQPTAPIWDETRGIYQLVLAQIYVGAGVSSISQEDITDKRTDTDVCGYIAGTVNEMDFSQFTAQFESYFSKFEANQLAEFEEWFDHMKDQLDSDAAGHLQAEVDEINGIIAPVQLTLTASQPYAIGEQFIYDGKLYTAISAIAENATIVIGTNASLSADIVKQINAATQSIAQNTTGIAANAAGISALNTGLATKTGSLIPNAISLNNYTWISIKQTGNVVNVQFKLQNNGYVFGTEQFNPCTVTGVDLPSDSNVFIIGNAYSSRDVYIFEHACYAVLAHDGKIYIRIPTENELFAFVSFTYIV